MKNFSGERVIIAWLGFHRRGSFVGSPYRSGYELSLSESHVVGELIVRPGVTALNLAHALNLEPSTISRILLRLLKQKIIQERRSKLDRRQKQLFLTEKGRALVKRGDSNTNRFIEECLAPLSASEKHILHRGLQLLADALGASALSNRPGEHHLRVEIKRGTRALGFLGTRFLGSDLSALEFQVLQALTEKKNVKSPKLLAEFLRIDPALMTRLLDRLEERNLLSRKQSKVDLRQQIISLSPKGKSKLRAVLSEVGQVTQGALNTLPPKERRIFETAFIKFAGLEVDENI